jgi:hypothetical protein
LKSIRFSGKRRPARQGGAAAAAARRRGQAGLGAIEESAANTVGARRNPAFEVDSFQVVIKVRIIWILLIGVLGTLGVCAFNDWRRAREDRLFGAEVLHPLYHYPSFKDKGYWVGDVTELYRLGKISRELAEADTAPLKPLVPKPIPFHGYYVRAMESGPSDFNDQPPVSFKGEQWCRDNFAILIYPAEPGPGKHTYLPNRLSLLHRSDEWSPVFRFPTDQERIAHWGIVD